MGRRTASARKYPSQTTTKALSPWVPGKVTTQRFDPNESMLHNNVQTSPEIHSQRTKNCLSISSIVRGKPAHQRGKAQAQGHTTVRRVAEARSLLLLGHPPCLTFLWSARPAKWARGKPLSLALNPLTLKERHVNETISSSKWSVSRF